MAIDRCCYQLIEPHTITRLETDSKGESKRDLSEVQPVTGWNAGFLEVSGALAARVSEGHLLSLAAPRVGTLTRHSSAHAGEFR